MEENNKNTEIAEENAEAAEEQPMTRRVYTKQQNMLYTIISIALFFALYFGGKGIMGAVNRPYSVFAYGEEMGNTEAVYELCGVYSEYCTFENARLVKSEGGCEFTALFSVNSENFAEEGIAFEYGDAEEDVRTDIYPYPENPWLAEHVFAEKITDTDAPSRELYLFDRDGGHYAKYCQYSASVPAEVRAVFAGQEKIYAEN